MESFGSGLAAMPSTTNSLAVDKTLQPTGNPLRELSVLEP